MTQEIPRAKNFFKNGFTIIELMIVVAIISVLIAIAVPSYRNYLRRAHYTEIVQAAAPYKIGVEQCFQINNNLNPCISAQNGVPPEIIRGQGTGLIDSIKISENAAITITPKEKYGIKAQDTYVLTPTINNDVLLWHTSGGGIANGLAN